MIAGAYVRKSNDQAGVVDEEKSVAFQIEHMKAFAASKERKARAGHVTGGVVFGYQNVRTTNGGRQGHVELHIVEAEAAVVRRIFEMAAEGTGYRRIAIALNNAGAVAPKPRRTTTVG